MKKLLVLSTALISSLFAANNGNYDGYSYFAVGFENFKYSEKFIYTFNSMMKGNNGKVYMKNTSVAVKSKLNSTSPVYLSGGLIRFSSKWDLSMDFISTLKPNTANEDWLDRGDDSAITTNYATIMSNSMKFLMHYKITNNHRLTFGFNYILNTFKRFNDPDAETIKLVEETTSTLVADVGYWFESNSAAKGLRIKYELTAGIPVYENVENTAAPELEFDKAKGFNLDTSAYVGYTIFRGVELGIFGSYSYMYRDGDEKSYKGQKVIWPTNITQALRGGLQVTWKFR